MDESIKYLTVGDRSEGLYKEKGSKFIGIVISCYSEEQAKEYLDSWRSEHHQARHLCYAFRFGADMKKYRSSDDGEPSNSAGPPILGQIESFGLTNLLVGVVRYYGGTKLGVGGLINAYRTAAKDAIESADIVEKELMRWIKVHCNFIDMPHVMNVLKKNNHPIHDNEMDTECRITTLVSLNEAEELLTLLNVYDSVKIEELGIN